MARTVKDAALSTRAARQKLSPQKKPYYKLLDHGLHLGYRKGARAGVWVARWYVGDQKYQIENIGTADDTGDSDGLLILNFSQAQAAARAKATDRARVAKGLPAVSAGPYTVGDALGDYLEEQEHKKKSVADARNRIEELITPVLGAVVAAELTTGEIKKWHRDLAGKAPRLRTKKAAEGDQPAMQRYREIDRTDDETKRRRRASANRTLTTLKAALNYAWREGKIANNNAWSRVEPFENVDAARLRYLNVTEAKRLINASDTDFRDLVQAALQTGCRYGELCRLDVSDFGHNSQTIAIRKSKAGKPRYVALTEEGVEFFAAICKGRKQSDPMLIKHHVVPGREVGGTRQPDSIIESRWSKSAQARPMAEACKVAEIDPIGFHGLRHTYASLSVMAGVPLMVVAKQLGHSDTRMVEKHYGHLAPSFIADAVRSMAPRFGALARTTTQALKQ